MYFAKSNYVERYLDALGAEYKYRDSVRMDAIEPGWEKSNPCRPSSKPIIDDAYVYALRMEGGELAPPAIIKKTPGGYAILDGRQRIWAARENESTTFSAYEVIHPTEKLEALISLGANQALNGVRPPQDYAINEAIGLMEQQGTSVKEAALAAGVTPKRLHTELDTRAVRDELERKGVEVTVANGTLATLKPLLGEPVPLVRAYETLVEASATKAQAADMMKEMMKQPGAGRIIGLDLWRSRPETQERIRRMKGRKKTAKEMIFAEARSLRTVLRERASDADNELKEQDRRELARIAKSIDGKMRVLCGDQYPLA